MPTTLAGARYFVTRQAKTEFVPYGFERAQTRGTAVAFENAHTLPLGFVYTEAIDRSDYDPLDPVDKPGAMLQGAVIDDGALPETPARHADSRCDRARLQRRVHVGSHLRSGGQHRGQDRARQPHRPHRRARTRRRDLRGADRHREHDPAPWRAPRGRDRRRTRRGSTRSSWAIGTASSGSLPRSPPRSRPTALPRTRYVSDAAESPYYWGHTSQLVNLGYHRDGTSRVTIEPAEIGTLSFDSLKVWALPMADYPSRVAKLAANPMTDVEIGTNRVTGTVNSPQDGVLFLSIPYTPGWSATVDGGPVETMRVNTAYTGVPVSAGAARDRTHLHDAVARSGHRHRRIRSRRVRRRARGAPIPPSCRGVPAREEAGRAGVAPRLPRLALGALVGHTTHAALHRDGARAARLRVVERARSGSG